MSQEEPGGAKSSQGNPATCRQAGYFSDSRYGGQAVLPGPPVAPAGQQGCRAMTLAELCGLRSRLPCTPLCWPGSQCLPSPSPPH